MEAFPVEFCKAIKSYWNKRSYYDMDRLDTYRKTRRVARLGRKWRFGKLRLGRKIGRRLPSPVRLLARLRDAYVNVMLGLASGNRIRFSGKPGSEVLLTRRIPNARVVRTGLGKKFERRSNYPKKCE